MCVVGSVKPFPYRAATPWWRERPSHSSSWPGLRADQHKAQTSADAVLEKEWEQAGLSKLRENPMLAKGEESRLIEITTVC